MRVTAPICLTILALVLESSTAWAQQAGRAPDTLGDPFASWQRVDALAPGERIAVEVDASPLTPYEFKSASGDTVIVLDAARSEQVIPKKDIRRVVLRDTNDSGMNGATHGALIGAGAAAAWIALASAVCADCEGPGTGPLALFVGVGTGIGAGVGFLVDKLRRGSEEVYRRGPRASVTPIVAPGRKAIVAAIRF